MINPSKYATVFSVLVLTGCSKNVGIPMDMVGVAERICAVSYMKPEMMVGRIWFPSFKQDFYIQCKREDRQDKIEYTVGVIK